ncbi:MULTISPECIES: iron-containing alcohol dehydrogenase [unclassified Enterococcus]|uniref:iron-containing alcohol dehydrogenase family protein n=1 Tax=unclassified Enterococcus TaxID=2608891 RepID=UPI0015567A4E|nr:MULTISPECIES: iron-containing alcohol dehydrogenase [unclassified Enterococcus]MBS7576129.1 iron-containing alcohol dehydrogenase [Enterococcus sp. MMGLQ5-2]MBS7583362.1 iron-containing alcohol dehydrogenase [Enterococcus sp. MMGLQ5-1]NPD11222.1 iron-containing alcohol dehydrogenase [Enterococcus sp. MMGLQ5-1]NPD35965.1 iron-containing alcohol dehydrogenase [Enterococcus sp. MMGLQ5-2]
MANYYDFSCNSSFTYGKGVLKEIKRLTLGLGNRYLIVTGCGPITEATVKTVRESLENSISIYQRSYSPLGQKIPLMCSLTFPNIDNVSLEYKFLDYEGVQVSYENVEKLAEESKKFKADILVCIGGGKVLDIVRAAATSIDPYNRPKVVMCPTQIASNASASSMSVFYNENGTKMIDIWNMAYPPEVVLLDTEIVVNAPVITLIAAIGDNLGNSLEMIHMLEHLNLIDSIDRNALAEVKTMINILLQYSKSAIESMERRVITKEFEWVVSTCSYSGGAYRSIGCVFLSHILDEILLGIEPVNKILHGLVIGYASLVEFVYLKKIDELKSYIKFYNSIGMPCTLKDLGVKNLSYEKLYKITDEFLKNSVAISLIKFTTKEIVDSVFESERIVSEYLKECN